jgi:hypothetical protein
MEFKGDNLLLALGAVSLLIGLFWSILLPIEAATPEYPASVAEITAGIFLCVSGILLIYQKGKGIFYGAVATLSIAIFTYLEITPYLEDLFVGAFCIVILFLTVLRRDSFEMNTLIKTILAILMHSRRLKISDLAAQAKKPEVDVEMALIKLRSSGARIDLDPETREVVYR